MYKLINLASQFEPKVAESRDEDSCTSTVDSAHPFELDGRRVILTIPLDLTIRVCFFFEDHS